MGKNIAATQNRTVSVIKLELESQIVRLLFGSLLEGIKNGYMDKPAVKITQATAILLQINPKPRLFFRTKNSVNRVITNTKVGTITSQENRV